jgi:hypothetical protein
MKALIYIAGIMATAMATSSQAQAVMPNVACELHIWPTENYIGINTGLLSGFGLVGALADQGAHKNRVASVKDLMREYLGPDVQMDELRKANVSDTLGLTGYRIVVEAPTPSNEDMKKDPAVKAMSKAMNAKLKSGQRLSTSTAPCYAELVGTNIFYHKAMMYGSNLFAGWTFRDYGKAGTGAPRVFTGAVKNPLEDFPAKTPDKMVAAKAEIRDAYAKDFTEYVQKKVRGPSTVAVR